MTIILMDNLLNLYKRSETNPTLLNIASAVSQYVNLCHEHKCNTYKTNYYIRLCMTSARRHNIFIKQTQLMKSND
jgi:hypothetical protein